MAGYNYTSLGYADEQDIENFLLMDIDNSFSQQIEDWIAAAEKQVNRYLGYTTTSGILAEQITNEITRTSIDASGDLVVFPRKTPIISISSMGLVRGTSEQSLSLTDDSGNPKYTLPTIGSYVSFPSAEIGYSIRGMNSFLKMSYIAGFTEVPPDIRLATVNLVAETIMRHSNKEGLEFLAQGRISKRWATRQEGQSDFVKDAYELLKGYRQPARWF